MTKRSAVTTVEVGSGQTLAIAGLLSEQVRGVASRVPGLGDVPVLGALFRSVNFRRALTELVILVTPEIVAPLESHQPVVLPGQDRQNPNDLELYALGLLDGGMREENQPDENTNGNDRQGRGATLRSQPDEMSVHGPWGHAGLAGLR